MAFDVPGYNVILFGKTGCGKSSFGNMLLSKQYFKVQYGMSSGAGTSDWEQSDIDGVNIKVTDVPGLSDTHHKEEYILWQIATSTSLVSPGPHVAFFLIAANRRFTKEEEEAYNTIKTIFTPDICRFMVVGFTNVDGLQKFENETREEKLREAIKNSPPVVKEILKEVDNRYIAIENSASDEDKAKQREHALKLIQSVYAKNHGQHYDIPEEINTIVQCVIDQRAEEEKWSKEKAAVIVKHEIVAGKQPQLVANVEKVAKKRKWWCNIL